jgi:hypothetical protein
VIPGSERGSGCVGDNYPSSRTRHGISHRARVSSGIEASLAFNGPETLGSATEQRMSFPFIPEVNVLWGLGTHIFLRI